MSARDDELLRLDYDRTVSLLGLLSDIRFKLLAIVPTVAGAAVGLLSRNPSRANLVAVGFIGLTATLGVLLYDHRNSEHYNAAVARSRELEQRLGFIDVGGATGAYGWEAPERWWGQRTGLGLVYSAALGAWAYVVLWGVLAFTGAAKPRLIGGVIAGAVGGAIFLWHQRTAPAPPVQDAPRSGRERP